MERIEKHSFSALKLLAIIVVVFVLQVLVGSITDIFKLTSSDVFSRPWILLTSVFLHGSLTHLLYNMFALALFGTLLEGFVGKKKFLAIFFVTGILASFVASFFYSSALGASGAIMGVIGALAILRPGMMIFAFGVPMPMVLAAVLWAALDLAGVGQPTGVAHIAHLSGMFFGILFGFAFREQKVKTETIYIENIEEW